MAVSVQADVVIIGAGIVGTYLAKQLIRYGKSVALIDQGAPRLADQQPASPPIECSAERYSGVYEARNHVLGGNGHYWGGGLLRPPSTKLGEILGLKNSEDDLLAEDMERHFRAAEIDAGAPRPLRWREFATQTSKVGSCSLTDYYLLTSKARNISMRALQELRKSNLCEIFTQAHILAFTRDEQNHISTIHLAQSKKQTLIKCSQVVLSAGTIDSLLILQKHAESLGLSDANGIGENLHDHITVPIATIQGSAQNDFMQDMLPLFCSNGFLGRQFCLNEGRNNLSRGLLRFIPLLDEASPYKEIKEILSLRQKGAALHLIAKTAAATTSTLPLLARIGYDRYVRKRLYTSETLPVQVSLMFESSESSQNQIWTRSDQRAAIHWRMNRRDEDAFIKLADRAYHLLDELAAAYGIEIRRPPCLNTEEQKRAYLHEHAMDAFHLGGGLPFGRVIDHRLRLIATPNMSIVATAVLQRPGLPNPTLTLLALARRCAEHIACAEAQEANDVLINPAHTEDHRHAYQRRMSKRLLTRCFANPSRRRLRHVRKCKHHESAEIYLPIKT